MALSTMRQKLIILGAVLGSCGSLSCMNATAQEHLSKSGHLRAMAQRAMVKIEIQSKIEVAQKAEQEATKIHAQEFQKTLNAAQSGDHHAQIILVRCYRDELSRDGVTMWLKIALKGATEEQEIGQIHYEIAKNLPSSTEMFAHLQKAIELKNAHAIAWCKDLAVLATKHFAPKSAPSATSLAILKWCAAWCDKNNVH